MNLSAVGWKYEKILVCIIFLILNSLNESLGAGACDRSRKVYEGVNYGEITDGINSNYTQVCRLSIHQMKSS